MTELDRLRIEWGIALASREKGHSWQAYLDDCRQLRAARGLPMPTAYAKPDARPILPKPAGLDLPLAQAGKGRWSETLIEERLTDYIRDCQSKGIRPRQTHYGGWPLKYPRNGLMEAAGIEPASAAAPHEHLQA